MGVHYGDFDVSGLEGVSDGMEIRGAAFEVSVEGVHGLAAGGYDYGVDIGDVAGGPGDDVIDVEGVFEYFEDSGEGCHLDALAEQAFVEVLPEGWGYLPTHVLEACDYLDGFAAGDEEVGDGGGLGAALGVDDDDSVSDFSRSIQHLPCVEYVPTFGAGDFWVCMRWSRWRL